MNALTAFGQSQTKNAARNSCRACGRDELELLIDLGPQPLAGGYLLPEQGDIDLENLFPLPIHICHHCGLVQSTHVIPAESLYRQYLFSSRTIQPLVEHFERYALFLKDRYSPKFVFEFGCNDGVLLLPLNRLGIQSCGVDLSENITALARQEHLNVITGYFNESVAEDILREYGNADIVTGSNVFAHIDEPGVILNASRKLLKSTGHLCLEVMYAGDLLAGLQWDSMYHEHLSFYCLQTLETLFNRYGFHVVDAERIPMHAGSLRVVASLDMLERPKNSVAKIMEYEESIELTKPEAWRRFSRAIQRKIDIVSEVMGNLSKTKRIWGYGAAGRATMWLNACKMNYLEAMVDASPLRVGRLMPGTHTPIVYPEALRKHPPDFIFVTAWNYFEVIHAKESWFKGIWAVPSPDLKYF